VAEAIVELNVRGRRQHEQWVVGRLGQLAVYLERQTPPPGATGIPAVYGKESSPTLLGRNASNGPRLAELLEDLDELVDGQSPIIA
jgi:hypothetical protein